MRGGYVKEIAKYSSCWFCFLAGNGPYARGHFSLNPSYTFNTSPFAYVAFGDSIVLTLKASSPLMLQISNEVSLV
jgi:hypothetical protein